ncbi:2-dehydropantoate 2-reductase [Virgibacillus sp. DJP39]|uniref:2-dehydropantoate 2-reductase n=1 Tax=Virgibacillus sp. DJP39 TaxID=3409790 RepID=UPI003BB7C7E6
MKIGIIGGGSVGLLVARYLCEYHDVTVYVRNKAQKQKLNDHGLFLSSCTTPCRVNALLTSEFEQEDCVIVCVKQPEISAVLPLITHLNEQTPILFLQNGMSHIEFIQKITRPVYIGIVTHGALRKSDHIVMHTGKGVIKLANFSGNEEDLFDLVQKLNSEAFPFTTETNWHEILAKKLVVNAVINPLTAIFEVPNGEIIHNTYLMRLAKELCREACLVLQLDFMDQWNTVQSVAANTKENISSMLRDIKTNRKSENDAISGYLIKKSISDIPYTTFVYNSIKVLEIKKGIIE